MAGGLIPLLRAFAWLRWRIFVNSLRASARRELTSRLAAWAQPIAKVVTWLMLLPAIAIYTIAAVVVGWAAAAEKLPLDGALPLVRIAAFFFVVLVVAGPLAFTGGRGFAVSRRLLLLPVERRLLHRLHYLSSLTDFWVLFAAIPLLLFPLGLLAGGAWEMALASGGAGLFFLLLAAALGTWSMALVERLLRRRQRAESLALVMLVALTSLGFLPLLLEDLPSGSKIEEILTQAVWYLNPPGQLYAAAFSSSSDGRYLTALAAIAALAFLAAAAYRLSRRAYLRLLVSTTVLSGSKSAAPASRGDGFLWRLPGFPEGTSAVAASQLRIQLRTVSGKVVLIQPALMVVLVGVVLSRAAEVLPPELGVSPELVPLLIAAAFAALAPMNIQFNQFAADRGGLSQLVLLPVRPRDVIYGKAVACVLLAVASLLPAAVAALLVGRPSAASALAGLAIAFLVLLGAQLLLTPVAALASALLPRAVNLNKPFTQAQPHNLAVLLGLFTSGAAVALPASLALGGTLAFASPWGTLALLALWSVAMFFLNRVLLPPIADLVDHRREAILLATQER